MRKSVFWHSVFALMRRLPFHAIPHAQTPEQFDALVRRIEIGAYRYPKYYRTRLRLLAFLGYGYICAVLSFLCGVVWVLHWICLSLGISAVIPVDLVVFFLGLGIIRLLWLHIPAPKGVALTATDAPELFKAIALFTQRLNAPPCHHILLTDDLNAAIVQRPRLGLLGGQTNYLLLGLPLMKVLSPQQFQAVVLHELGHLSGNDGRFSAWIYQLRQLWFDLAERFELTQQGNWLFRHFFQWYAPFFNAYSFVLARANEYKADRAAVRWAGVNAKAEALLQIHIYSQFLYTTVWPKIYNGAIALPTPPDQMITTLLRHLQRGPSPESARTTIELALMDATDNDDSHPCLSDRLRALGYTVDLETLPHLPVTSAAHYFLASNLDHWVDQLDIAWVHNHQKGWAIRHRIRQQQIQCLNRLTEKSEIESLTLGELWQQAYLTQLLQDKTAAIAFYKAVLRRSPHHPQAHYQLGKILVEQDIWDGIAHLEQAMTHPALVIACTELLYEVYQARQQWGKANACRQRRQQHQALWAIAKNERTTLRPTDRFQPHQLPSDECQQLIDYFHQCKEVHLVYLVKKVLTPSDDPPIYLFGVVRQLEPGNGSKYMDDEAFSEWLQAGLCFAADLQVVIFSHPALLLCKAIRQVHGARLYLRRRSRR